MECEACKYKNTPRSKEEIRILENRLNRIIGQLGGIENMIRENRYCGDILTQLAAAESGLRNLSLLILQNHLETCVTEEIKKGNEKIVAEAIDLIKKFK